MTEAPPDRRVALKARHRQAIVDAAAALIAETGGVRFTIDDLARRADVSRRTVFNHFASVDDIVAEVFGDVVRSLVDSYAQGTVSAGDGRGAVLDELVHAVRATDLVGPMAFLTQSLRSHDDRSARLAAVLVRVLDVGRERLASAVLARHPGADALDLHLLVDALFSGLLVLHRHWDAQTGAVDDPASRAVWDALVDRLVDRARHGFAAGEPDTP